VYVVLLPCVMVREDAKGAFGPFNWRFDAENDYWRAF